jgi:hypothetical protein
MANILGTETILIVEDELAVRLLTRVILERAGYRAYDAANPAEAEAVFEEHADAIGMLITDVVMPGSSGSLRTGFRTPPSRFAAPSVHGAEPGMIESDRQKRPRGPVAGVGSVRVCPGRPVWRSRTPALRAAGPRR